MNLARNIRFLPTYRFQPETLVAYPLASINSGVVSLRSAQHVDKFIRDCKEAGVWSNLLSCLPFIGSNLATAIMDIKRGSSIAGAVNFVEADYTEATGLTGNGSTKYLNVGYNTSGFPQNTHLSFYQRTDSAQTATRMMLGAAGASDDFWLGSINPSAGSAGRIGASISATEAVAQVKGFYMVERQSGTDLKLYRNNTQIAANVTNTSHAPPTQNFFAFAYNANGSPAGYINTTASFLSIGLAMTAQQRSDFAAIVQTLQTNLGRAV